MKPTCQFEGRQHFPRTDYFFHSGFGEWRSNSSPDYGDRRSEVRRFHKLSYELLVEAARERTKEMTVFAFVVLAAIWPVIYMVITVVELLSKARPL